MKSIHVMTFVFLALSAAAIAWFDYSVFWPVRTLEIHNFSSHVQSDTGTLGVVNVESTTIAAGTPVAYRLDYCKYTTSHASVKRTLVDGQIISLADSAGYLPVGCHKTLVETSIVPETVNPGRYYLDIFVSYKINIFRTEIVHYRTNYFEVVPAGG